MIKKVASAMQRKLIDWEICEEPRNRGGLRYRLLLQNWDALAAEIDKQEITKEVYRTKDKGPDRRYHKDVDSNEKAARKIIEGGYIGLSTL